MGDSKTFVNYKITGKLNIIDSYFRSKGDSVCRIHFCIKTYHVFLCILCCKHIFFFRLENKNRTLIEAFCWRCSLSSLWCIPLSYLSDSFFTVSSSLLTVVAEDVDFVETNYLLIFWIFDLLMNKFVPFVPINDG